MKFKKRTKYRPVRRHELEDEVEAARQRLGIEEMRGTTHAEYAIAEADFYAAEKKLRDFDKLNKK